MQIYPTFLCVRGTSFYPHRDGSPPLGLTRITQTERTVIWREEQRISRQKAFRACPCGACRHFGGHVHPSRRFQHRQTSSRLPPAAAIISSMASHRHGSILRHRQERPSNPPLTRLLRAAGVSEGGVLYWSSMSHQTHRPSSSASSEGTCSGRSLPRPVEQLSARKNSLADRRAFAPPGKPKAPPTVSSVDTPAAGMTRSTALKTSSTKRSRKPQTVVGPPASDTPAACAFVRLTNPCPPPPSTPGAAIQITSAPLREEPPCHCASLATRRQWILSAQWVLLLAAIVWLATLAPWWTCAAILPLLLITLWLYSLILAGIHPPETLVRLDIARVVIHAFDSARCMAIRVLGGESKQRGPHR